MKVFAISIESNSKNIVGVEVGEFQNLREWW